MTNPANDVLDGVQAATEWLQSFYRGDRDTLEVCYREHFAAVEAAVAAVLRGPDRETVVQEVFARLVAREDFRRSFKGGSVGAWLKAVARYNAIDFGRRLARETNLSQTLEADPVLWEEAAQARILIERFRRERLPPEWATVFDLCFVQQMTQREAASALGLSRTTIAYRELRIRRELRRFVLEGDWP
jgi:RNA polymerase sigma-70 factor, ECF subfamily